MRWIALKKEGSLLRMENDLDKQNSPTKRFMK